MLESRISDVKALDPQKTRHDDEVVHIAERRIRSTVLDVFGEYSPEHRDHRSHEIQFGRPPIVRDVGFGEESDYDAEDQSYFAAGIPRTIAMLEGLIETVRERTVGSSSSHARAVTPSPGTTNKVFIVHGRRDAPRDTVARFVSQFGLDPIILQEQASAGRTIIEKFERHSDVGFAVVLLTGEDRGGLIEDDPSAYQPRARQNVILELGYFVGKPGRERVCVLYEHGVEVPSDFHGVVYLQLDPGNAWKLGLAREMKVAGLAIDLNKALG